MTDRSNKVLDGIFISVISALVIGFFITLWTNSYGLREENRVLMEKLNKVEKENLETKVLLNQVTVIENGKIVLRADAFKYSSPNDKK